MRSVAGDRRSLAVMEDHLAGNIPAHHGEAESPPAVNRDSAETAFALVICRDHRLTDIVMAAAASCGANPRFVREPDEIRRWWPRASSVLIGADMAPIVADMGLATRAAVHLMAGEATEAIPWSIHLGASVMLLPEQSACLPAVLGRSDPGLVRRAVVIDVMGGHGGVGASTLAAALAQRCVAQGLRSALVDLDVCGGGVDLMFDAEREPGWRWGDLESVSGTVNDIAARLPRVNGFPVLSMDRPRPDDDKGPELPADSAMRAVLDSICRNHDVVVLDDPSPQNWPGVENAPRLVLVAGSVRAVMAARARTLRYRWQDARVVVRTGPGMSIDPHEVANSLDLPLAGAICTDRRLIGAAQVGEPPGRRGGSRFAKQVDAVLASILGPRPGGSHARRRP